MNKVIPISIATLLLVGACAFNLGAQEQYASSPADLILGTVYFQLSITTEAVIEENVLVLAV